MLKASLVALFVVSPMVVAQTAPTSSPQVSSEFFYQPAPKTHAVTPEFNYVANTIKGDNSGIPVKSEVKRSGVRVEYDYGLNQMFSLGAALEYSTAKDEGATPTTIEAGLNDIEVNFKGTYAYGPGNVRFGSDFSFSPGDKKYEANGNSNAYSGGNSVTPYLGYDMGLGKGVIGVKVSKDVLLGKAKEDNQGVKTEVEGGEITQLDIFYEQMINQQWNGGAAISFVQTADTKSGGTSTENINPIFLVALYAPVKVGSGEILPELRYSFTTDDEVGSTKIDKYDVLGFKVGYRFNF